MVNNETKEIGEILTKYFYQWPIYNLNLAYLKVVNRKMVAIIRRIDEDSLQPLDWEVAGEQLYYMQYCLVITLVFVLLTEMGLYKFLVRPIIEPLFLYAGHYSQALRLKKRRKLYSMRKDCQKFDIEASDDEEERRNTLALRKILKIVDTDP